MKKELWSIGWFYFGGLYQWRFQEFVGYLEEQLVEKWNYGINDGRLGQLFPIWFGIGVVV